MDIGQQFCLRWNNYQSTLQHIFHKLWMNGTFVDVSLVVEGRRIGCHKVVLSACSTYFESLLKDHGNHPHPLVILHDLPYSAVESLVTFMYKGEVNVSQELLTALLKVAEALKIKGLADSAAIANFSKYRLMLDEPSKVPNISQKRPPISANTSTPPPPPPHPPVPVASNYSLVQPENLSPSAARCFALVRGHGQTGFQPPSTSTQKRSELNGHHSPKPQKKRKLDNGPDSLPPSPPTSLGEIQNSEQSSSTPVSTVGTSESVKQEIEEETDNELQIDESIGNSASEATESDTHSNQNTPGPEYDQLDADRLESAESLASLATYGAPLNLLQQHNRHILPIKASNFIKEERALPHNPTKNGERSYTLLDLEEGIERVLMRELTPAKAIAKYKIPRRTFFRRLSAVRKSRGIPSSKENASDHFLNTGSNLGTTQTENKGIPLVIPGIVSTTENHFLQSLTKTAKLGEDEVKKDQKVQNVMTTGSVLSLLTAKSNYDYYLNCLKLQNQKDLVLNCTEKGKDPKEMIHTVDDNRNLASRDLSEATLVTQNGNHQ